MFPDGPKPALNSLEKKRAPLNMNNFYYNLPGGDYRARYGQANSEERTRMMDAIDQLLTNEFQGLDTQSILETIKRSNEIMANAFHLAQRGGSFEVADEVRAAKDRAKEELRPLFNRLIDMGFPPELLAR